MQDTEENRWLLLDMARAMGGYGYDEEIHAPRFSAGFMVGTHRSQVEGGGPR